MEQLLTVKQAAEFTSCSEAATLKWVYQRRLPAMKVSRSTRLRARVSRRITPLTMYAYQLTLAAMSGLRLREWRQSRRLSLRRLGAKAGVHWVTLYRIEQGRISPTVALLDKLAKALEVEIADLFSRKRRRTRRR